jgi:hypothetical protein
MSSADVFNEIADDMGEILPESFPDTLTVVTEGTAAGTAGMKVNAASSNTYTGVPCIYEQIEKFAWRKDQADKNLSTQKYKVTIPTHHNGSRMTLTPANQRLIVAARGDEPAFTLRMDSVATDMGVVFVVIASKEN